jgi:Sulfatase-modifying factor enzyme 1
MPSADSAQRQSPSALHLRVFLASPGDVADERTLALQVLEQLQYDPLLRGRITVETVAWDKPGAGTPMLAIMTPQEAIKEDLLTPAQCDIVIVIFWSRMGTPLPEEWKKPDGSRYLSGTEWEYLNALEAAEHQGRPAILVYRRTEKISLDPDDPDFETKSHQWRLVKQFFNSFQNPDGSIKRGCNPYTAPDEFREQLNLHLRKLVRELLEREVSSAAAQPASPALPATCPPLWPGSPFPGLRAFTPADAPIFFGRGRETDGLVSKLADPAVRFLVVVGASGSGKSSLVAAGLIPRLMAGAIAGSQDWIWGRFTPGEVSDNPFMALALSFRDTLQPHGQQLRTLAEQLATKPTALAGLRDLVLADKPTWAELVLFIDQFEELFTLAASRYVEPFIEWLRQGAQTARFRAVVTLRSDFYHRCVERPPLAELLRTGSYPLAAPSLSALYEIITGPAERAGLIFEKDLAHRVLVDTGIEPGALALLAFALHELYEKRTPTGLLTYAAYNDFQGVQGAIAQRAETVFSQLDIPIQSVLNEVFRELINVDAQLGIATRRRAVLDQVRSTPAQSALVDRFTAARLLVTSEGEDHQPRVEVAHEALLQKWPRLAMWIEAMRDDLRQKRQLQLAVQEWEQHDREHTYLWPSQRVVREVRGVLQRLQLPLGAAERDFLGCPLEPEEMLVELDDTATSHERRALIGVRLSLIGDTRPGVGLRKDGLPDIGWCKVPGGEITLEFEEEQSSSMVPPTFKVEPFYIAKYPVTYAQYRAFLEAADGYHESVWWRELLTQEQQPGRQYQIYDNNPAENVSWLAAVAFCRWMSKHLGYVIRLPTEWEWQQAATGGDATNVYPWGPKWDAGRANTSESDLNRTTAVGLYPHGISPVGALDMSGNVWEWCLNEYDNPKRTTLSGDARRIWRGGSWYNGHNSARTAFRTFYSPNYSGANVGFRLACLSPMLQATTQTYSTEAAITSHLLLH